jgi:RNA polymerase sigma factor (sigma-70 family)
MEENELAGRFEGFRPHLRAVAYRMLGSLSESEDAVQEAWLRLSRTDAAQIENLGGWLTTAVSRICLDLLRSRAGRREEPLLTHLPDPVVGRADAADPEREVLLADSVGLALLVVLEALAPAERVAFVLHDMFAVPFEDIARVLDRTPAATRQLASRARRRVQDSAPASDADPGLRREIAEAFMAAARGGDFDALVAVLDPDVVLRVDTGTGVLRTVHGAADVAGQAVLFKARAEFTSIVLVNGSPGILTAPDGKPVALMAFTVRAGKVVEIDLLADPERLAGLG